jgi:hypothetical protein
MSVYACPFFPDFPENHSQAPLTLLFATDTQTPQTIVPVFLVHTLKDPFCENPHCVCQEQRVRKNALLVSITRGEVMFRASTRFHDPSKGGKQ